MTRLSRLHLAMQENGYDGFIATRRPNQLYFTPAAEPVSDLPPVAYILYTADEVTVIPGQMFYYAARDGLPDCLVVETLVDGVDPVTALAQHCQRRGLQRVVCDRIEPAVARKLRADVPGLDIVEDARFGSLLRRKKEADELVLLRAAARISDLGIQAAFATARPGVTNREIAAAATEVMLAAGCEEVGLQVASGSGTAYMGTGSWVSQPWRKVEAGDMLLVDMGILYHGYLGDQTRTAAIGDPTPQQQEIIETVQQAYRLTRDAMRPGATAQSLYAITVDLYREKGWHPYFPHHISHGLGLGEDVPRIAHGSQDVLESGDTLSCEPGVYLPGIGGARFENMLLIRQHGAEELTQSPVDPVVGTR